MSLNDIKERLKDKNITDEEAENIRGSIYGLAEIAIELFETNPALREKALRASAGRKLSPKVALKLKELYHKKRQTTG